MTEVYVNGYWYRVKRWENFTKTQEEQWWKDNPRLKKPEDTDECLIRGIPRGLRK